MSWFDSSGFAGFAKTALSSAQKKIDRALDIEEDVSPKGSKPQSLSPEQRQGRKSTPVVAYAGGGAFGAYAPYTPSTETESPQKKVDQGDWGNQSSLWSSWFDFSEDQNAEVGKSGVEKGTTRDGEAFESPVVAAQPPSGGAGDIQETVAMGTKTELKVKGRTAERKGDVEKKRRGSQEKPDGESKKPKSGPLKLGQRISDEKRGDSAISRLETDSSDGELKKESTPSEPETTSDLKTTPEDDSVLILLPAERSTVELGKGKPDKVQEQSMIPVETKEPCKSAPEFCSPPFPTLPSTGIQAAPVHSLASLSASVCWEVNEDDKEVEAILRKNEENAAAEISNKIPEKQTHATQEMQESIPSSHSVLSSTSSQASNMEVNCGELSLDSSLSQTALSTPKDKLTDSSTTDSTIEPEEEDPSTVSISEEEREMSLMLDRFGQDGKAAEADTKKEIEDLSMLSSVSSNSTSSSAVKELLGDAMTESLNQFSDPSVVEKPPLNSNETIEGADAERDESSDGSVSDGKVSELVSGYNSSDEHHTACTTSDEREETGTSSDIEIISNPSILDGDTASDSRFDVASPHRSFTLHSAVDSADVIFHHHSLMHLHHHRTPSQSSSSCGSAGMKKQEETWRELNIDVDRKRPNNSNESEDSPFESPPLEEFGRRDEDGDAEDEAEVEVEKSAASVRQRLKEDTEAGHWDHRVVDAEEDQGARTPRASRSRKSSERHPSHGSKDDAANSTADNSSQDQLVKKISDMSEIIQAREAHAFELSKMNAELTETVNILRQQLVQAEAAHEAETTDSRNLTDEFTRRLGEAETRLRATAQDRDQTKRELNQAQKDLQAKSALEAIVKEKEDLIQELMEEGTKLSHQLGSANTALRKLRAKEKESEVVLTKKRERMESSEKRIQDLETALEDLQQKERSRISTIDQLEENREQLEANYLAAQSKMEDDTEKMESLKVSHDAANKEILALNARLVEADALISEAEVKADRNTRKVMAREFERTQEALIQERDSLSAQLEDLRIHISRHERDQGRREDLLKQEISGLQMRLQEADARNEELMESMSGATLPLLRQIENLKMTMNAQASSWETVEVNLSERLADFQDQFIFAEEKERSSSEELLELRGKMTLETSRVSSLATEKALFKSEVETLKSRLQTAEESKVAQAHQMSSVKTALTQEIGDLKMVKVDLENQVQILTIKVVDLEEQQKSVPPAASPQRSSTPRPYSPPTHFPTPLATPLTTATSAHSLYNVVRDSVATSIQMEEMQCQLKQKDGEICQLQTDIMNLELTRESMANELVDLANSNITLEEQAQDYPRMKKSFADMEERYNAMLQMYGEKVEEFDELRMDLEHVKTMYKTQIEELLQKATFR